MLRRLLTLLLLLCLPTTVAARPASPKATPALWVVKDADTTIYLFGTIHLLPSGYDWLHGPVKTAFDASDTLVLETLFPDDPTSIAPMTLALGFTPGLPPLSERVDAELRPRLKAAALEVRVPMEFLDSVETWLAAVTLSSAKVTSFGLDPHNGVENQLTVRAKPAGKALVGLETIDEHMRLFDGLPEADQRAFLNGTIEQWSDSKAEIEDMLRDWAKGDAEALAIEMNESIDETPQLVKVLVTDRNARWSDWITRRMAQPGTLFVAVGAGHLAGPDSVQAMLAKRGLQAERVQPRR